MPAAAEESLELAYNAVAYRRLSRALREFRPDFVYERYAANTFAGLAAARRHGVPFVLEVNSPLAQEKAEHDGLFFRGVTRRIERRLCAGADVTIAVTRVLAGILEDQGVPAGKIVVMPNGVRREFGDGRRRRGLPPPARHPAGGDRRRLRRLVPRLARPGAADRGGGLARVARGGHPSRAGRRRPGDARPARDARRLARSRAAGGPLRPGAARRDRVGARGLRRRRAAGGDRLRLPDEDPGVHGRRPRHRRAGVGQRPRAPRPDGETALLCPGGANPAAGDLGAAVLALARDPALRARLGAAARASLLERGYLWEENARRVEELVRGRAGGPRRPSPCRAETEEVTPC